MRIALVNTMSTYIRGGAEILVDDLAEQLKLHGHETSTFRLPFPQNHEASLVTLIESARMLCFDEYDRVIAFKFPAYCIRHQEKVVWLFHQFRQVYELWNTEYGFKAEPSSEVLRSIIKAADDENIPCSRHIYTNAIEVSNRLKQFNNIDSKVLMPPLKEAERYYNGKTGDYFFFPSRLTFFKRQHLAIEAMKYVKSGVRLVIAGRCDEKNYIEHLKNLITSNSLEKRVELLHEWISDERKIELMANSLGCIYIPYKEDSCGFVSYEAFYSGKPVIACTDSGGTRELVENGVSGFEVDPDPKAIAKAIDMLYEDKLLAKRMGNTGRDEIIKRDITWPATIRRLLK